MPMADPHKLPLAMLQEMAHQSLADLWIDMERVLEPSLEPGWQMPNLIFARLLTALLGVAEVVGMSNEQVAAELGQAAKDRGWDGA
jgi:hypothetical protein